MTDRPILFSGPMVRGLLAEAKRAEAARLLLGSAGGLMTWPVGMPQPKTQTRRLLTRLGTFGPILDFERTPGGNWQFATAKPVHGGSRHQVTSDLLLDCLLPYRVGDRLWVREAWRTRAEIDHLPPRDLRAEPIYFEADHARQPPGKATALVLWGKPRPGMFMPRWASRLTLTVTDVRVQRLQQIDHVDAIAEGIGKVMVPVAARTGGIGAIGRWGVWGSDAQPADTPQDAYLELWDSLNADRAPWASNPWIVAVTFTVDRRNIDDAAA